MVSSVKVIHKIIECGRHLNLMSLHETKIGVWIGVSRTRIRAQYILKIQLIVMVIVLMF